MVSLRLLLPVARGRLRVGPFAQEDQHLAINSRGQGLPQETAHDTPGQEDRPALPAGPRGNSAEHEGRDHQGRTGRDLQAVQEEGMPASQPSLPRHEY